MLLTDRFHVITQKMRRWVHEEEIDAMQQRLDDNPKISVVRRQTVEHPFGTIKMWMGATHFLYQSDYLNTQIHPFSHTHPFDPL